mmetsp:Transcript_24776/g.69401  ORF Transcript_24776/g.69401 Transcript_24776/m.69401 type:complete len:302 (+) Transcript_24776:592-1497(+)
MRHEALGDARARRVQDPPDLGENGVVRINRRGRGHHREVRHISVAFNVLVEQRVHAELVQVCQIHVGVQPFDVHGLIIGKSDRAQNLGDPSVCLAAFLQGAGRKLRSITRTENGDGLRPVAVPVAHLLAPREHIHTLVRNDFRQVVVRIPRAGVVGRVDILDGPITSPDAQRTEPEAVVHRTRVKQAESRARLEHVQGLAWIQVLPKVGRERLPLGTAQSERYPQASIAHKAVFLRHAVNQEGVLLRVAGDGPLGIRVEQSVVRLHGEVQVVIILHFRFVVVHLRREQSRNQIRRGLKQLD